MKSHILYASILILLLPSCIDGDRILLDTTVQGKVYDAVKDKDLAGVTVNLYSCKRLLLYGVFCTDLIDSTRTDVNGNFYFSFNSRKGNIGYDVRIVETDNFTRDLSKSAENYIEGGNVVEGKRNELTLYGRELNHLVADLQVRNNNFPPLSVVTFYSSKTLWNENVDTTLVLKVLPQAENSVSFTIWDKDIGRYRKEVVTLDIGMEDTVRYSTIINVPDLATN